MSNNPVGRREFIKTLGVTGGIATCATAGSSLLASADSAANPHAVADSAGPAKPSHAVAGRADPKSATNTEAGTRAASLRWWQQAHFGMFIHWGLYSLIGRQEWTLEMGGIPLEQYELSAKQFNPRPGAAREWAKLAKQAGQKYMVMTSKHHDGFCLFDGWHYP